jgi:hypothetical protein
VCTCGHVAMAQSPPLHTGRRYRLPASRLSATRTTPQPYPFLPCIFLSPSASSKSHQSRSRCRPNSGRPPSSLGAAPLAPLLQCTLAAHHFIACRCLSAPASRCLDRSFIRESSRCTAWNGRSPTICHRGPSCSRRLQSPSDLTGTSPSTPPAPRCSPDVESATPTTVPSRRR